MDAYEFLVTFFSFAYALGLTHILLVVARMARYRSTLVFSWPHFLWMVNAALLLLSNWISLWDFRNQQHFDIGTILILSLFVVLLYLACAMVSPDFGEGDSHDLEAFHRREGRIYIGMITLFLIMAFVANVDASDNGVLSWGAENRIVLPMIFTAAIPMIFINHKLVQLIFPLLLIVESFYFLVHYYPQIS
jgi:hypothetical protein